MSQWDAMRTPETSRRARRRAIVVAAAVALVLTVPTGETPARAGIQEQTGLAGIGPGSPLTINRPDLAPGVVVACTANFLWEWTDPNTNTAKKYLGTAGHCLKDGPGPLATRVRVCAELCVFGSWSNIGNQVLSPLVELCGPSTNTPSCSFPVLHNGNAGNDFALIEIPSGLWSKLRPEVPVFGGPSGSPHTVGAGDALCIYGTGFVAGETTATKARPLAGVGTSGNGHTWYAHGVVSLGDSGAPVVTCEADLAGAPVGLQTHALCTGGPGVACGTTLARAQQLANTALPGIQLVQP